MADDLYVDQFEQVIARALFVAGIANERQAARFIESVARERAASWERDAEHRRQRREEVDALPWWAWWRRFWGKA